MAKPRWVYLVNVELDAANRPVLDHDELPTLMPDSDGSTVEAVLCPLALFEDAEFNEAVRRRWIALAEEWFEANDEPESEGPSTIDAIAVELRARAAQP